ncbi:hypothetical protein ABW19_dt0210195 [Dactylella cylindrospora]|nr:hypothetical protein ABW19_dt0210195 [Dactylella cylindrospora]
MTSSGISFPGSDIGLYQTRHQDLEKEQETLSLKEQALFENLRTTTPPQVQNSIVLLETALANLYKLAVLIRGDYDSRRVGPEIPGDKDQRLFLLNYAVASFDRARDQAVTASVELGIIQERAIGLQSDELPSFAERVQALSLETKTRIADTGTQFQNVTQEISGLTNAYYATSDLLRQLKDKLSTNERLGFAFFMPSFGIPDPGLEDQIRSTETKLNQIQAERSKKWQEMSFIQSTKAYFEQLDQQVEQLQAKVSVLGFDATRLTDGVNAVKIRMDKFKEITIKLASDVRDLSTMDTNSLTKEDFAGSILEICATALIDFRVKDEVEMIQSETINEYGVALPPRVQTAANFLNAKLAALSQDVSLEGAVDKL